MEQSDRDMLIRIDTHVQRIIPLVEKHERDINRGKGIIAFIITSLTLIGSAVTVFFKSKQQ